jgi:hypothetical protein
MKNCGRLNLLDVLHKRLVALAAGKIWIGFLPMIVVNSGRQVALSGNAFQNS